MRFVEFIKWWWEKNDWFVRTLTCFILFWALPCGVAAIWLGDTAITVLISGIFVIFAGWILQNIYKLLKGMWDEFNDSHPPEDIALIRKLKGIPTPSRRKTEYYD